MAFQEAKPAEVAKQLFLTPDPDVECEAQGGEAFATKRHVWWNFVSSDRERINQAKEDWREGRFPKVPGDEEEFIPLPDVPKTVSYP